MWRMKDVHFKEERIAMRNAGCDDLLTKPIVMKNLLKCLKEQLGLEYLFRTD